MRYRLVPIRRLFAAREKLCALFRDACSASLRHKGRRVFVLTLATREQLFAAKRQRRNLH